MKPVLYIVSLLLIQVQAKKCPFGYGSNDSDVKQMSNEAKEHHHPRVMQTTDYPS